MSNKTPDKEPDYCEVDVFDPERVAKVRKEMLASDHADHLAELFQSLGNPTRVRILHSLFSEELCVCDLAQVLRMSSSAVSHQLRVLRAQRLVKFRKEGKMAYYSIDDEHVRRLFALGLDHVQHM
jgi:DNA-binding transcriptional ArsR family regulator